MLEFLRSTDFNSQFEPPKPNEICYLTAQFIIFIISNFSLIPSAMFESVASLSG